MGSGDRDADESKEAIMHATYLALCKHGFSNLTMQDIADEMDRSRTLLHYHYDTKEDLLEAFLDRMIGWIGDRLTEEGTEHPVDRLVEYINRFVIPPDESRQTFALAILELRLQAVHNESFREKLTQHYEENVATVAEIIEAGIDEGSFTEVDAEALGEAIYTAMVGARTYQVTLDAGDATTRMATQLWSWLETDLFTQQAHEHIREAPLRLE